MAADTRRNDREHGLFARDEAGGPVRECEKRCVFDDFQHAFYEKTTIMRKITR